MLGSRYLPSCSLTYRVKGPLRDGASPALTGSQSLPALTGAHSHRHRSPPPAFATTGPGPTPRTGTRPTPGVLCSPLADLTQHWPPGVPPPWRTNATTDPPDPDHLSTYTAAPQAPRTLSPRRCPGHDHKEPPAVPPALVNRFGVKEPRHHQGSLPRGVATPSRGWPAL